MGPARDSWREACDSALGESDPQRLLGCIEYAITALERRYAQWESDPGTSAELIAIQEAILTLERHIKESFGKDGAGRPSTGRISGRLEHTVGDELGHLRRLFLVPRS